MQFVDTVTYLPDDILTRLTSIYVSLSGSKSSIFNHNVVEFARKLPMNQKIKNDEGKIILKKF